MTSQIETKRNRITTIVIVICVVIIAIFSLIILLNLQATFKAESTQVVFESETASVTSTPESQLTIGSTWTRPRDGMVMVYVPSGEFTMGLEIEQSMESCRNYGNPCSYEWFEINSPKHTIELAAYWIDQTEVTNAMYSDCVNAGICNEPVEISSRTRPGYYLSNEFSEYPVIHVTWEDAKTYCYWVGGRLPTEAEWEKAARGFDDRIYPWGNSLPNYEIANYWDTQDLNGDTVAVGSYPNGASPYGALDMAGNVWEWVNDYYDGNYYSVSPKENPTGPLEGENRVVRGGTWHFQWDILSTIRLSWNPESQLDQLGFRCARSAE